jgi:hypothetical protein
VQRGLASATLAGAISLACTATPRSTLVEAGPAAGSRVPASHRPAGSACPPARGPGALSSACSYDAGAPLACHKDADCTAGKNGRCLPTPGVACAPACSYDTCFSDADCPGTPCDCRASASDSAANVCLPGGCAVDSDCGPGGYCSPSGLTSGCGLGYFCHTPSDACVDSADCPSTEGCSYDTHALAWSCATTCTRPP